MTPDPAQLGAGRAVARALRPRRCVLAAITREGEEALLLDGLARARRAAAPLLLHRAAPSAALRRGRGAGAQRRLALSRAAATGATRRRPRCAARRRLARRLDGRDGALLRAGRRRAARRQLRAAGRPEPDRGGGLRLPGGDGAAHLQFRARRPSWRWRPARALRVADIDERRGAAALRAPRRAAPAARGDGARCASRPRTAARRERMAMRIVGAARRQPADASPARGRRVSSASGLTAALSGNTSPSRRLRAICRWSPSTPLQQRAQVGRDAQVAALVAVGASPGRASRRSRGRPRPRRPARRRRRRCRGRCRACR